MTGRGTGSDNGSSRGVTRQVEATVGAGPGGSGNPQTHARRWRHALRHGRHPIVTSGGGLLVAAAFTNAAGFIFWLLAANGATIEAIGVAAASVTASGLAATITAAGVTPWLLTTLGRHRMHPASITAIAAGAAGAAAIAAVVVTSINYGGLQQVADDLPLRAGIAAVAAIGAVNMVLDAVFVAGRKARWVLARNALVAAGKVAIIATIATVGGTIDNPGVIVAIWAGTGLGGTALSLLGIPSAWRCIVKLGDGKLDSQTGPRRHSRNAAWNHAIGLSSQLPNLLLPLLVVAYLGADANAAFYIAWNIAGALFIISPLMTNAYLAEGARAGNDSRKLAGRTLGYIYLLLIPATAAVIAASGWVLSWFGNGYQNSSIVVTWLAIAVLFDAFVNVSVAQFRVDGRLKTGAAVNTAVGGATVALAWATIDHGIWAVAAAVAATRIIAAITLSIWWIRQRSTVAAQTEPHGHGDGEPSPGREPAATSK